MMRFRAMLFFTWALVLLLSPILRAEEWGTLKVKFTFGGPPPKPEAVKITQNPEFCGKQNVVDEMVVVDPDTKGVANVIGFMYFARGVKTKPPVHPDFESSAKSEIAIENKACRYEPHVVLLRTTQTLLIKNPDPIGHNTKVDSRNKPSNNNLPAGGEIKENYPQAEDLPIPVGCNVHPWMKGWLVLKDHPYMAASGKDGTWELKNVPAGKWTFRFWQEGAGFVRDVKVKGKMTKWDKGLVEITMTKDGVDLGEVEMSAKMFEKK